MHLPFTRRNTPAARPGGGPRPAGGGRSRKNSLSIIAVVLAVAGVAAIGVVWYASSSTQPNQQTVGVVVVTDNVPAGTSFTSANVAVKQVPIAAVPINGALSNVSSVLGAVATIDLPANHVLIATEAVSPDHVAATGGNGTTVSVPLPVKKGDVAISIPFDQKKAAGGFIRPDDHIDMLIDTGAGNVRYALQDVLVLRVGTVDEQGSSAKSVLVVEVDRVDAERLGWLEDGRGTAVTVVAYVLRSPSEFGKGYLDATPGPAPTNSDTPVTQRNWSQLFPG